MKFNSQNELKKYLYPVLRIKKEELNKELNNIKINEDYIWDNLKKEKWINSKDLSLSDMVNDILCYKG